MMTRRGVLAAWWSCAGLAGGSSSGAQPVQVSPMPLAIGARAQDWWVDLSLPPQADVPAEQRQAQAVQVREQQNAVAREVFALGGQVVGRVSLVRNALAVRISSERLTELGRLPGVTAVRPMRQAQRAQ
jgi:hypothetical protein